MPFQKYNKTLLTLLLSISTLSANEKIVLNENILSNDRLEILKLEKEQIQEDSAKLKKDWINPIIYSWSKNIGETYTTEKSLISIDQPIFKAGGIYKAIKYANSVKKYSNLSLDLQKKALIKDTTQILFNIHRLNHQIKKQELLVANGKINVQIKQEEVLNGLANTTELDNAILENNIRKNALIDLKYQKIELINSFSNYASGDYKSFSLPKLQIVDKDFFINNSLNIKQANADIESKNNLSWMTTTQYLPTLSATYDYTNYHKTDNPSITDDTVQNYGLKITIPLDVRTFNDIQSSRIDYLKAKLDLQNKIIEEENFFKNVLSKLSQIEEKKEISKEDYLLYDSILKVMIEEKNAELKTQNDVDIIKNSKDIKKYELEIHKIDEQLQLLEIYAKVN